ncbi:MAG: SDR family NAD(P)-dependent oxidoreductase [Gammaproteobacteria bacterium]
MTDIGDATKTVKNKAVVIAGGAGGLGLATAKMMASRGARIALVDIDENALDPAVAELGFAALSANLRPRLTLTTLPEARDSRYR